MNNHTLHTKVLLGTLTQTETSTLTFVNERNKPCQTALEAVHMVDSPR
jgi:hypothetical protein